MTDARQDHKPQRPDAPNSLQSHSGATNDASSGIISFLRLQGFVNLETQENLTEIANRFKDDVSLLPTRAVVIRLSFVNTTNEGRAAFCASVAIKSEMKADELIENLSGWSCDSSFIGITPVFVPQGDADVDIIAVHGLQGHPIAAWKNKKQESQIWLRDWLPKAFEREDSPKIRVLLCGYDTKTSNNSCPELGNSVLTAIHEFRSRSDAKSNKRPIIFIAHSLGGLVLKEAMLAAVDTDPEFLAAIYAILLFGVPNTGLRHEALLSEVNGKPCDQLARDLVVNEGQDPTTYLENLSELFGERFNGRYKIDVFYEKMKSIVSKVDEHGVKTSTGGMIRKVDKVSATMVGVRPDFVRQLDVDHVGLVRYEDEFHAPYLTVRDHLHLRAKEAPKKIAERFRIGEWGEAEERKTKRIIESLDFVDMDLRRQGISEAASQTYEWMLSEDASLLDQDQEYPPCQLSEWLANGDGVFWVCGKPGSGKSTLMEFVTQNTKTLDLLETWASGSPLVIAEHYFWYPGRPLQKSYEGFARTLLKKILEADPTIAKWAFPGKLTKEPNTLGTKMSQRDLHQALLNLNNAGVKMCLFVDGLDECHPQTEQESVKSTICELAKLNNIKLCVSSREWRTFEEAFQSPNMLRLEDINRKDIQIYVSNAIQKSILNRTEVNNDDRSFVNSVRDVELSVVDKSAGVFLWSQIVTRNIAERLEVGQDVKVAQQFVDKFPGEIEDYFKIMIYKRIPPTWREDGTTIQALKLAMLFAESEGWLSGARTQDFLHPPYLISWWFLARSSEAFENERFGVSFPFTKLTSSDLREMHKLTRNFLKSACQDMLQIINDTNLEEDKVGLWFERTIVTFTSRIVYDFLSSKAMDLFHRKTPGHMQQPFLIQLDMAKAKLVRPLADWPLIENSETPYDNPALDCALHHVKDPDIDLATKTAVVVECQEVAIQYLKHAPYGWHKHGHRWHFADGNLPSWITLDESYLVSEFLFHGCDDFLREKLKCRPTRVTQTDLFCSIGEGFMSELDFPIRRIGVDMIESFLAQGLSPNEYRDDTNYLSRPSVSHEDRSAWAVFLAKCFKEAWGSSESGTSDMGQPDVDGVEKLEDLPVGEQFCEPYRFPTEDANHAWTIAKLFLQNGADLDKSVCVVKGICRLRDPRHRYIKQTHICQLLTALDILRAILKRDQRTELGEEAKRRRLKWPEDPTVKIEVCVHLDPGLEDRKFWYTLSIDK